MSGRCLESYCPIPVPHHAANDRIVDYDNAILDNEVWRYARRLADAAAHPPRRPPRVARGVRRACLLFGAALAGLAAGMQVGGSGALPLDSGAWRQLIAEVSPWDGVRPPAMPVLVAGATLASTARTVPGDPARAPAMPALGASMTFTPTAPPVAAAAMPELAVAADPSARARAFGRSPPAEAGRDTEWSAAVLVEGVMDQVAAHVAAGGVPPEPAPLPPAAGRPAPYRVQLALLRNPRNAGPVWRSFVKAVRPLAPGLERFVEATPTKYGLRHLVQAGPFDDAGAAEAVCRRVIAAGGECFVVPPPA